MLKLVDLAQKRQGMAFRPGTDKNHRFVLAAFVAFLEKHGISFLSITDEIVLYTLNSVSNQLGPLLPFRTMQLP